MRPITVALAFTVTVGLYGVALADQLNPQPEPPGRSKINRVIGKPVNRPMAKPIMALPPGPCHKQIGSQSSGAGAGKVACAPTVQMRKAGGEQ